MLILIHWMLFVWTKMIMMRSRFASICLFSFACAIAFTEYFLYAPAILQDISDDLLSQGPEEEIQNILSQQEMSDTDSPNKELDNAQIGVVQPYKATTPDSQQQNALPPEEIKEAPFENSLNHTIIIENGETILSALDKIGINKNEAYVSASALSKVINLRHIKSGQKIVVSVKKVEDDILKLDSLEFRPDKLSKILVKRDQSGKFFAEKILVPIKKVLRNVSGMFDPASPIASLQKCGIKNGIANEAFMLLNNVAKPKAEKSHIGFEILYQDCYNNEGESVSSPSLLYTSALINGKIFKIYKFENNGKAQYVDSAGKILQIKSKKSNSELSKPFAQKHQITSHFGTRVHPIHRTRIHHNGVDFAASIGTPVYAAADGTVVKAHYCSGYGKYISLKHSSSTKTGYGHLSKICVKNGQNVSKGQLIAYSGNTGRTTGPHLHFETIQNGKFVNPLNSIKLQNESQNLSHTEMLKFNQQKRDVNIQIVGLNQIVNNKTAAGPKQYS